MTIQNLYHCFHFQFFIFQICFSSLILITLLCLKTMCIRVYSIFNEKRKIFSQKSKINKFLLLSKNYLFTYLFKFKIGCEFLEKYSIFTSSSWTILDFRVFAITMGSILYIVIFLEKIVLPQYLTIKEKNILGNIINTFY